MSIFSPSNTTLSVTLLILPDCSMMSVACTLDPMRAANRIAGETLFSWTIETLDGEPVSLTCGLPIMADAVFSDTARSDVLIIIAGFNSEHHARQNTISKLAKVAPQYKAIGGMEAGSWLMARAGILNGYSATTHWEDLEDFASKHPGINVIPDRFVIDGRYFTSGGASPAFDLMLQLLRLRKGMSFSMEVASVFIYDDAHASSDAQMLVSLGKLSAIEPRIAAAIKLMETSLDEPLSISTIAHRIAVPVRTLETLFNATLQSSPGKYYRHLRLQLARRLLTDTNFSIQEIAIRTGFNSSSAFSRTFKVHFGTGPRNYHKQESIFLHNARMRTTHISP